MHDIRVVIGSTTLGSIFDPAPASVGWHYAITRTGPGCSGGTYTYMAEA